MIKTKLLGSREAVQSEQTHTQPDQTLAFSYGYKLTQRLNLYSI